MSTNTVRQFTNDVPASRLQLAQAEPGKRSEWLAIWQDIRTGALPLRELPAFFWYLLTTSRADRLRE